MTDQGKKGPKNIQDLKAKLGLKKPGAGGVAPPPGITPPPGMEPAPGDIAAPPGLVPPPGVQPPPGVAPPAITPPPGMPAPAPEPVTADKPSLVAPPGFKAPPKPLAEQPVQDIDVDMDVVGTSKGKKTATILIAIGACFLCLCGGFYVGDIRLKRDWVKKSKASCLKTSKVIKQLHKGVVKFESVYEDQFDKTKKGRRPLSYYNPTFFPELSRAIELIDVTTPKVKGFLNKNVWTTHYRFVKNAQEILPRLHTFLALLAQLKAAVSLGMEADRKFGPKLKKLMPNVKPPKEQKKPLFGVLVSGDFGVMFGALGDPVKKGTDGKCVKVKADKAEGYKVGDECFYFTKQPTKRGECAKYDRTLRYFRNTDKELFSRLKCLGEERVVFQNWLYNVLQIKLLIAEIKRINSKDLYLKFRKSSE